MTGLSPGPVEFDRMLTEALKSADRFGHRQHVHLTWLAVVQYGVPAAVDLISDGIRHTARYAGAPQKYHATVSQAWVQLVGHHAAALGVSDFDGFVEHEPALLDKRLLIRFYTSGTLATSRARTGWVEPDRAPFPWQHDATCER